MPLFQVRLDYPYVVGNWANVIARSVVLAVPSMGRAKLCALADFPGAGKRAPAELPNNNLNVEELGDGMYANRAQQPRHLVE